MSGTSGYAFSWFALPVGMIAATSLVLGILVLVRTRASPSGAAFAAPVACFTGWLLSCAVMYSTTEPELALRWARSAQVFVSLLPLAGYLCILVAKGRVRARLPLLLTTAAFSLLFCWNAVTGDSLLERTALFAWGYYPQLGRLGTAFVSYLVVCSIVAWVEYTADFLDTERGTAARRRLEESVLMLVAVSVIGVDLLPMYGLEVYPLGYLSVVAFLALFALQQLDGNRETLAMEPAARRVIETMQGALLVLDPSGRILGWNPAAARLLGYTGSEFDRMWIDDVVQPATPSAETRPTDAVEHPFPEALLHDPTDLPMQWRTKDGGHVDVSVAASTVRARRPEEARVVVVALDTTARCRMEQTLKASTETLRTLVQAAPLAVIALDAADRVTIWNPAAEAMFGWRVDEVLGLPNPIVPPDRLGEYEQIVSRMADGRPLTNAEMTRRTKTGGLIDISMSTAAVFDTGGRISSRIALIADMTEHNRADEEMRRYAERLRNLHELDQAILLAQSPAAMATAALSHLRSLVTCARASVTLFSADRDEYSILAVEPNLGRSAEERAAAGPTEEADRHVVLPLVTPDQPIGTLDLVGYQSQEFLDVDLEIAREVADALAVVLHQARQRATLAEAEERYRSLFEGVPVGLYRLDDDGRLTDVNAALIQMLGYTDRSELVGRTLRELHVTPEDHSRYQQILHDQGVVQDHETRLRRADGVAIWVQNQSRVVRDSFGDVRGYEGSIDDITSRKEVEERLVHDALHDTLTGLPNRSLFMARLAHSLEAARRRSSLCAVLFVDFDRFKLINDSLGHRAGDELLRVAGRRLESSVRRVDTVARLGGDEFAILLEDVNDLDEVIEVTARIQDSLARPVTLGAHEVVASASIGIAVADAGYQRPDDLVRDADIAMYRAKALGRNRYEVFDTAMHRRVVDLMQVETDLRRALRAKEFALHYQPIVDLVTGTPVSAEALVRWQHPRRGLIHPAGFLGVAEESGLIVQLGEWVLNEACNQARRLRAQHPDHPELAVSVNISGRQYRQNDLLEQVREALDRSGLEPRGLQLELTENVVMEDADAARATLSQLRDLGVRIHIDDFGTGFSSLSLLNRFPVDALKMDRSFIAEIGRNGENTEIVEAIVSVAHSLRMSVVAEGIERLDQLTHLRRLGCDLGQGLLFAEPMPVQALSDFLSEDRTARSMAG